MVEATKQLDRIEKKLDEMCAWIGTANVQIDRLGVASEECSRYRHEVQRESRWVKRMIITLLLGLAATEAGVRCPGALAACEHRVGRHDRRAGGWRRLGASAGTRCRRRLQEPPRLFAAVYGGVDL